jgi:hypothetical protein
VEETNLEALIGYQARQRINHNSALHTPPHTHTHIYIMLTNFRGERGALHNRDYSLGVIMTSELQTDTYDSSTTA